MVSGIIFISELEHAAFLPHRSLSGVNNLRKLVFIYTAAEVWGKTVDCESTEF